MDEFLFERNRHLYFNYFHIDEKKFFNKRIFYTVLVTLASIFLIATLHKPTWFYLIPIAAFITFKYPYFELMAKAASRQNVIQYEFISFLRYFISLLASHGNIYQTLKATKEYVQEPVKSLIEQLLRDIDDKKIHNRDAFLKMAEEINSSDAYLIMELLYEFYEEGIIKEDLRELENTILLIQENKTNELIEKKVQKFNNNATMVLIYGMLFIIGFTAVAFVAYFQQIDFSF